MFSFVKSFLGLSALSSLGFVHSQQDKPIRIVMVPKYDISFFDDCRDGCIKQAAVVSERTGRNVTCTYLPPVPIDKEAASETVLVDDGAIQAEFIFELMQKGEMDALAVAALDTSTLTPVLNKVVEAGIPVVTFDSDAPDSKRAAYVGTENFFFGQQLGKATKRLLPEGGTYVNLYSSEAHNLIQRMEGVEDEMTRDGKWKALDMNPIDIKGAADLMDPLREIAQLPEPPTAVISTMYIFMNDPRWSSYVDEFKSLNMTFISADASQIQLQHLATGYAHGLVAQLPYSFGTLSVETLYSLLQGEEVPDIVPTDAIAHILEPVVLPKLKLNQHLLNNLSITGFVLFGLVICASIALLTKSSKHEEGSLFALMMIAGSTILGAAIVPLSFDDDGDFESMSDATAVLVCMTSPWLAFAGLGIVLATLFAKTAQCANVQGRKRRRAAPLPSEELVKPIGSILAINVILLMLWTIIDPYKYVREDRGDRDGWDRVNETYGVCKSEDMLAFLIPLAVVNGALLLWTSWKAETLASKIPFGVKVALTTLRYGAASGIPIILVARNSPEKMYMFTAFVLFIVCCGLLFAAAPAKVEDSTDEEEEKKVEKAKEKKALDVEAVEG